MTRLREDVAQAKYLLGILWYWGSFPLSFVTYAVLTSFTLGFFAGRLL